MGLINISPLCEKKCSPVAFQRHAMNDGPEINAIEPRNGARGMLAEDCGQFAGIFLAQAQ